MSYTRIRHKTKERYKRTMRKVVDGLGRSVKVFKYTKRMACPNCFYDKATDSSTGKCKWSTPLEAINKQISYEESSGSTKLMYKFFRLGRCPICKGTGYLTEYSTSMVKCIVNWGTTGANNELLYTPAGESNYTSIQLKTSPKYLQLFRECFKLEIDGVTCRIVSPPAIRGLGSQTVLLVTAAADNKLSKDTIEIIKDYS